MALDSGEQRCRESVDVSWLVACKAGRCELIEPKICRSALYVTPPVGCCGTFWLKAVSNMKMQGLSRLPFASCLILVFFCCLHLHPFHSHCEEPFSQFHHNSKHISSSLLALLFLFHCCRVLWQLQHRRFRSQVPPGPPCPSSDISSPDAAITAHEAHRVPRIEPIPAARRA
jgi:hypothetical protein